jgi:heavy metal sensor kinase
VRVETGIPDFNQKLPVLFTYEEFAGTEYRTYSELLVDEITGVELGFVLQLLHPLDTVHSEISRLKALFFWTTPLPILLVILGGWWVAGRALQPVRQFIDEVNSINADRLNDRIRVSRKDELGELATAFNFLLNRIETTFQSLKRFTADAAHQLRTPLTSIRAMSEIALSRERDKSEYRDKFANVLEEVDHLLELSESLMQLARADAGLVDMNLSSVNISELLHTWIENMRPLAEEKNAQIMKDIAENMMLESDPVLLEAILINLLANAINYTPDNGQIRITLPGDETSVDIYVCDNGPGIPDEYKTRVFDRFVRLEKTRHTVYGSGLGLAIVKAAVDAHQGAIAVTDNTGGGSCFHVKLPILKKTSG